LDAEQPARDRVRALALVLARRRCVVPPGRVHRLWRRRLAADADGTRATAHALPRAQPLLVPLVRPYAGLAVARLRCGVTRAARDEIHGVPCVTSLAEIEEPIDLVDVFRRPEAVPPHAREAAAAGAGALWLQVGIMSAEARRIAEDAGLDYVENACTKVVHKL